VNWQEVEVRTWLVTEYFQQHSELPHLTLHLQPVAHPIPVQKHSVEVGIQLLHERTLLHLWTLSLHGKLRTMQLLQMKLSALLALLSPLLV
jgi:hypothetical protein